MQPQTTIKATTIASRILAMTKTLLKDSEVPAVYHQIIINMVIGYLKKSNEEELKKTIAFMQNEILPYILTGDNG
jgi:hypothetical protein